MQSKTTSPLIGLFQMQTDFFSKAINEISNDHATEKINEKVNHIAWLTGHIVSCRFMLGGMLGLKVSEPYPEIFGNLKGMDDKINYPSLDDLSSSMPEINSKLLEKLGSMSDEDLNKEAFGGKLIDIVLFFIYHEAYHIGQIGILRKALGYDAIKHG